MMTDADVLAMDLCLPARNDVALGVPTARLPEFDRIAAAAIAVFGVDAADFWSYRRYAEVALARHVALFVARKVTAFSLPELGRASGRDHSAVLHGVRRVAALVESDPALAAKVAEVEARVTS